MDRDGSVSPAVAREPTLTPEARDIIELIDRQRKNPLLLATPLGTLMPIIRNWIMKAEARLAALEGRTK